MDPWAALQPDPFSQASPKLREDLTGQPGQRPYRDLEPVGGEPRATLAPMADASGKRRGHGVDATYFAADKNPYIGAVSVGFGPDGRRLRRKVSSRIKQEVRDKLREITVTSPGPTRADGPAR